MAENERRDERGFFSGAVFTVALLFLLAWLRRSGLFANLFGNGTRGTGPNGGGYGSGANGGQGGGAGSGGCCSECEDPKYPPVDFPTFPPAHPVLGYNAGPQTAWNTAPQVRSGFVQSGDPRLFRNPSSGTGTDNLGRTVTPTADNTVFTN